MEIKHVLGKVFDWRILIPRTVMRMTTMLELRPHKAINYTGLPYKAQTIL
jgi:hypothetical protein